jgi:Ca2+-binding EF-hand superfamily protein
MGEPGEVFEALDANHDGVLTTDELNALDQDGDGVVTADEFKTVASATHTAKATTSMNNVTRTFCHVNASVGFRGEASMGARDGRPPTPPRALSPEPEPEPEPRAAAAAAAAALSPASFSDADALAQLMGPPISDALLQSLLDMSTEERMRLAEELLRSLDPDDLRALLQKMRRFPWEVDCEAQTDHSGDIGTSDASEASPKLQPTVSTDTADPDAPKPARPKTLFVPEKRALNQFLKGRKDKKAKPQGLKTTRRLIAKVYEDKVAADEADDLDMRARDGFPTFLCDYMLKEFGIKSLANANLTKLIKSVMAYADPENEHYDERVHVFGKLSGILAPYDYRTVEVDFICDYILALFVDPSSIDENMEKESCVFGYEQATELLEKQFKDNNMPMPGTTAEALLEAGAKSGKTDDDGVALINIDHLLEVVHQEYVLAVQEREAELIAVFQTYDKVRAAAPARLLVPCPVLLPSVC